MRTTNRGFRFALARLFLVTRRKIMRRWARRRHFPKEVTFIIRAVREG